MKARPLRSNTYGLSIMYDAVLFLVLVSLSGVILFPALQPKTISEVTIEELNEKKVDDIHQIFLSSMPKQYQYSVAADIVDYVAGSLGINTSQEDGLYENMVNRVIGHELHHSTFAQLIVENLAVQWRFFLFNQSVDQLNILTSDYSSTIKNEIQSFLDEQIQPGYQYHFKASWYPINGVCFGGLIRSGESPPETNYYISKKSVSMPFPPALSWDDKTVVFSEYWIESMFLQQINNTQNELRNISLITQNIQNQHQMENSTDFLMITQCLSENLTHLFMDFTVNGIFSSNNSIIFPGVVDLLIDELFSSIISIIQGITDEVTQTVIGEGFAQIESFFSEMNTTNIIQPFEEIIINLVIDSISTVLNTSFSSIDYGIDQLTFHIKQYIADQLFHLIQPLALQCASFIVEKKLSMNEAINMISSWVNDQFSLSQATMTLTIWEE